MKTYTLLFITVLNALLLIGYAHKNSQKAAVKETLAQAFEDNPIVDNESSITINGKTHPLISDPCVPQDNDDLNMLTFKAVNDDMDYTLTVNLGAFNNSVNSGNYVYSNGETQVNFAIITFVTENGTFVNSANSVVVYTKNGNNGEVSATNISLMDHFETLPNMTVSFNIKCAIE
jgi:hypothetical protein